MFKRTIIDITYGTVYVSNHLIAKADGELSKNILPIPANKVPTIAHAGYYTCINKRTHAPAITNKPPIEHPILMPNLSNTQLHEVAMIG